MMCVVEIDKMPRATLLEACNKFNDEYLGLKVIPSPSNKALCFSYAVLVRGYGRVESLEIISLFRHFQRVVRASLVDEEVFDFLK